MENFIASKRLLDGVAFFCNTILTTDKNILHKNMAEAVLKGLSGCDSLWHDVDDLNCPSPKEGEWCIVIDEAGDFDRAEYQGIDPRGKREFSVIINNSYIRVYPTHWANLPKPDKK